MTIQDLGSIGEFVGSLLVLATLLYLARQVGQARKSMLLNTLHAQRAEVMSNFRMLIDSPYLPQIIEKLSDGEELNAVEERRLGSYISLTWATIHATWAQRTLTGAVDILATDDAHFAIAMTTFGERGTVWWKRNGRTIYPEPFVAYIDAKLASFQGSELERDFAGLGRT